MSEDTLRRGLASGVAATGFAAFEGAKPGRSTDLRGVVGDGDGGGAAAAGATRAASPRARGPSRDRAPPGTCCWSQRAWGASPERSATVPPSARRRRRVDHQPRRRRRREAPSAPRAAPAARLGLHGHDAFELRRHSNDGGRRTEPRRQRVGRVGPDDAIRIAHARARHA